MPVVQVSGQLVFFAHVPKCAGTAIERYLQLRFGPLGFRDSRFLATPPRRRWTKSSPQHIDTKALERLLPISFFSASFAVVRHPIDRIHSVFLFQRDIERTLPKETVFGDWVEMLPKRMQQNPFYLDNHTRPMTELVPDATTVFRLEDGLDKVVSWLDDLADSKDDKHEIRRFNSYQQNLKGRKLDAGPGTRVTDSIRHRIAEIYAADLDRFGYLVDEGSVLGGPAGDAM